MPRKYIGTMDVEPSPYSERFHNKFCLPIPEYNPRTHYADVATSEYFLGVCALRDNLRLHIDKYFRNCCGALSVDLFTMTSSVSSPMGPGSDSEVIPIELGGLHSNLVDSSQFGFEPLVTNRGVPFYCFLPSMRGEESDARHLSQFFHAEYEAQCELDEVLMVAEGFLFSLVNVLRRNSELVRAMSRDLAASEKFLRRVSDKEGRGFQRITFDKAFRVLEEAGEPGCLNQGKTGRDITSKGEIILARELRMSAPFWITHYDRDRVPFYHKPIDGGVVLNADLIIPPIIEGAVGGEVLGAGQRQDEPSEMYESLKRQGVPPAPYEWYIDLRRQQNYRTTSGFGLGFERFLSMSLGLGNIRDSIVYPRLRGEISFP